MLDPLSVLVLCCPLSFGLTLRLPRCFCCCLLVGTALVRGLLRSMSGRLTLCLLVGFGRSPLLRAATVFGLLLPTTGVLSIGSLGTAVGVGGARSVFRSLWLLGKGFVVLAPSVWITKNVMRPTQQAELSISVRRGIVVRVNL